MKTRFPGEFSFVALLMLMALGVWSLSAPAAAFSISALDIYAQGREEARRGRHAQALELFASIRNELPHLQDYLLFDEALARQQVKDMEGARRVYRELLAAHRSSHLYREAYRRLLELTRRSFPLDALSLHAAYLREFPDDARVLFDYGQILEAAGAATEARAVFLRVFLSGGSLALPSLNLLTAAGFTPSQTEIAQAARQLREREFFDEVITLLRRFPPTDEAGSLTLAQALFNRRRYQEVVKLLTEATTREGRLLLASSLARAGERARFSGLLLELARPGMGDTFSLHLSLAEMTRREGNHARALEILALMRTLYPDRLGDIGFSHAWLEIRRKDYSRAEAILTDMVRQPGGGTDQNFFWLGKVRAYQGKDPGEAFGRLSNPQGYHFLKAMGGRAKREPPFPVPGGAAQLILGNLLPPVFRRLADLLYLDMRAEAAREAQLLLTTASGDQLDTLARILAAARDYHSLVRLGIRHNIPSYRYPLGYYEQVRRASEKHRLSPLLVIAVMREESHFRPDVVSRAGARGLMQLMPATAKRFGRVERMEELFDVERNIALGVAYLARLKEEFPCDYQVLAAYNAGEASVRRWLAGADYRDEDEFAQDIPFLETRGYVLKVMRTYFLLRLFTSSAAGEPVVPSFEAPPNQRNFPEPRGF